MAPLVHRQYQRTIRRIEIYSDDSFQLARKMRLVADLETVNSIRLQAVGSPELRHRTLGEAIFFALVRVDQRHYVVDDGRGALLFAHPFRLKYKLVAIEVSGMKNVKFIAMILFSTVTYAQVRTTIPRSDFVVFDGTLYMGKPDLSQFGLKSITIVYSASMWGKSSDSQNPPDAGTIRSIATQASRSTGIAVLDIEKWPLTGDPSVVANSISKYRRTIQLFKQAAPSLKVGYYGVVPVRNYWDAIGGRNSPKYRAWQTVNNGVSSIANVADALFPSLYTFYKDQNGWRKYAIEQIAEARRLAPGKPVYVFLWPQFHDSSGGYLPVSYWRIELEIAKQYADGIVIWGGWHQAWNSNAPWWLETQRFLRENNGSK